MKLSPMSAYRIFNNEESPLFFKDYSEYFGTLHTVVYIPKDLSVIVGIGGNCEPYSLSLYEWLKKDSDFPEVIEGSIEGRKTS